MINWFKSELSFTKSKRALETEVENYSRLQKEVSEKLRRTLPLTPENVNPFEENDENVPRLF